VNAIIRFSHKMVYPKLTIQFVNPNCPIVYSKQKDAFMANLELDMNLLTKKKKKLDMILKVRPTLNRWSLFKKKKKIVILAMMSIFIFIFF